MIDQYQRWERTDYLKNAVELMRDDKPELAAKLEALINSDRRAIKARVDQRTVEFLAQENARLMERIAGLRAIIKEQYKITDAKTARIAELEAENKQSHDMFCSQVRELGTAIDANEKYAEKVERRNSGLRKMQATIEQQREEIERLNNDRLRKAARLDELEAALQDVMKWCVGDAYSDAYSMDALKARTAAILEARRALEGGE
jgi:chromosome segregation ATPase